MRGKNAVYRYQRGGAWGQNASTALEGHAWLIVAGSSGLRRVGSASLFNFQRISRSQKKDGVSDPPVTDILHSC